MYPSLSTAVLCVVFVHVSHVGRCQPSSLLMASLFMKATPLLTMVSNIACNLREVSNLHVAIRFEISLSLMCPLFMLSTYFFIESIESAATCLRKLCVSLLFTKLMACVKCFRSNNLINSSLNASSSTSDCHVATWLNIYWCTH